MEDLIDPHNVNAVFRTGECLGIQKFHVIDNEQHFHVGKGVSKGSTKWIDIDCYDAEGGLNSESAIQKIKDKGLRLLVTSPSAKAIPINEIDISKPLALVIGNERDGVSDIMKRSADQLISIPMYGFTESFNVSVASAILIHSLSNRIHQEVVNWEISEQVKANYRFEWYKKSMARPDYYQKFFVKAYEAEKNL